MKTILKMSSISLIVSLSIWVAVCVIELVNIALSGSSYTGVFVPLGLITIAIYIVFIVSLKRTKDAKIKVFKDELIIKNGRIL